MENQAYEVGGISEESRAAQSLLSALWRSLDYDKFNRRNVWGIFERKIKSAARQNIQLPTFFEQAKRKLSIAEISRYISEKDLLELLDILKKSDMKVLKEIRENTTLCLLLVRLDQQQRRADYEVRQTLENNDDTKQELQI